MIQKTGFLAFMMVVLLLLQTSIASAAPTEQVPFSIQVTPSPIIETLTPGESKTIDLSIRNNSTITEKLKIEPRTFTANQDASQVSLGETIPPVIGDWITFSNPVFVVRSGESFTQKITIRTPKDAGFSYAFALVISRANEPASTGGTALRGSVAVFTLLNVDREGATRSFELESFTASRRIYEYLPTEFEIKLKNTGNTIAQPYGTIYIQRRAKDVNPIDTLPVNAMNGSVLPNTSRTFTTTWTNGFPVYESHQDAVNAQQSKNLIWDWSNLDKFRFGRYTAKAVVVYNDGQRDVPLEATVEFWVLPWKLIIAAIVVLGLIGIGLYAVANKLFHIRKLTKRRGTHHADSHTSE